MGCPVVVCDLDTADDDPLRGEAETTMVHTLEACSMQARTSDSRQSSMLAVSYPRLRSFGFASRLDRLQKMGRLAGYADHMRAASMTAWYGTGKGGDNSGFSDARNIQGRGGIFRRQRRRAT